MVVPGKNMGIRPTNHVDTNGRCYHPYLAYWSQNPDVYYTLRSASLVFWEDKW